ncbi:MAG: aminoglycoside phosphotransferase family protein [Burkholderiaceae bacterium]
MTMHSPIGATSGVPATPARLGTLLGRGRTAEVFTWSPGWVIKLFYPTQPFECIEREAAIAANVFEATMRCGEFRVPQVGEIVHAAGRHGLLYREAAGTPMAHLLAPPSPASVEAVGRRLGELHFAMHRVRPEAGSETGLPMQRTLLDGCFAGTAELPARLHDAARRSLPLIEDEPGNDRLCHGDFHPLNVLASGDGPSAVIDWWSASRGHAGIDVAKTLLLLEFGRTDGARSIPPAEQAVRAGLRAAYQRRYFELAGWSEAPPRLPQWMLLAIVARLNHGVESAERSSLLAFAQQFLQEETCHE